MDLNKYFERIQFTDSPRVDLHTLTRLQQQHLLNIPYENLDVQLGRPLDRDINKTFEKIVIRQRGGWCYEMNGLLGWALEEIGFDVTYLAGGVNRAIRGDSAIGNHLVILVLLDGKQWIVDAGFGDGFFEPIPFETAHFSSRGFNMNLEPIENGFWRFSNHPFGGAPSFDFQPTPASTQQLDDACQWLQVDPESPFVRVLILQRFTSSGYDIQVGLVAKSVTTKGVETRLINDIEEFQRRLEIDFGILEDIKPIWSKLVATHEALFTDTP